VTARVLPDKPGQVVIESIEGDNGRLSLDPAKNCIGIAAMETLKLIGQPSCGVALTLRKVRRASAAAAGRSSPMQQQDARARPPRSCAPQRPRPPAAPLHPTTPAAQGLPLGSGMGSSAASAGAAAWAVNGLFGCPVGKDALVQAGVVSEATVSGYHADNIAPAIMGGFVLVRCAPAPRPAAASPAPPDGGGGGGRGARAGPPPPPPSELHTSGQHVVNALTIQSVCLCVWLPSAGGAGRAGDGAARRAAQAPGGQGAGAGVSHPTGGWGRRAGLCGTVRSGGTEPAAPAAAAAIVVAAAAGWVRGGSRRGGLGPATSSAGNCVTAAVVYMWVLAMRLQALGVGLV